MANNCGVVRWQFGSCGTVWFLAARPCLRVSQIAKEGSQGQWKLGHSSFEYIGAQLVFTLETSVAAPACTMYLLYTVWLYISYTSYRFYIKTWFFLRFTAYHFPDQNVDIFQLHKITVGSEDFSRYSFVFSKDPQVDGTDYTVKSAAKFPYCFPRSLSLK